MATECFQSIQGIALRVTRLDECGVPVNGSDCDFVVSEAFISIGLTPEFEEATEFLLKNAEGEFCLNELGQTQLKRYTLELGVCTVDTDLFNIISGVIPVFDFNGDTIGFEIDRSLSERNGFALEWWSKVPGDCVDPETGETKYIYWLLPWVKNGRILDISVENGPMIWALIGDAVASSSWGVGPYDVVPQDSFNTPGKLLAPMNSGEIIHLQVTTIPPPTAECGCGALPDQGYQDLYVDIYN